MGYFATPADRVRIATECRDLLARIEMLGSGNRVLTARKPPKARKAAAR